MGVDVNLNGRTDVVVVGVDQNRDGTIDALQRAEVVSKEKEEENRRAMIERMANERIKEATERQRLAVQSSANLTTAVALDVNGDGRTDLIALGVGTTNLVAPSYVTPITAH